MSIILYIFVIIVGSQLGTVVLSQSTTAPATPIPSISTPAPTVTNAPFAQISLCSLLSPTDNATFSSLAFSVVPRQVDERTVVLASGWAPSTDASVSTITIANDTKLPPFWLQCASLTSSSTATSKRNLLSFMDERFTLWVEFQSLNGGTIATHSPNPLIGNGYLYSAVGSSATPGQFLFDSISLPIGNWSFSPVLIAFGSTSLPIPNPQIFYGAQVVSVNRRSSTNSSLLVSGNNVASLLRFSLTDNVGLWYTGKPICALSPSAPLEVTIGTQYAAGGFSLPPFSVEIISLSNRSINFAETRTTDPNVLPQPDVVVTNEWDPMYFSAPSLRVSLARGSGASTVILQEWWMAPFNPRAPLTARIQNITLEAAASQGITAGLSLFIDFAIRNTTAGGWIFPLNRLVLNLIVDRIPRSACAIQFASVRTPTYVYRAFSGFLGVPIEPLVPLEAIYMYVTDAANRLSGFGYSKPLGASATGTVPSGSPLEQAFSGTSTSASSTVNPVHMKVSVIDEDGVTRNDLIGGVTTVLVSDGLAIFRELYFPSSVVATLSRRNLLLRFSLGALPSTITTTFGTSVLPATTMPFTVISTSSGRDAVKCPPRAIAFDIQNSELFTQGDTILKAPSSFRGGIAVSGFASPEVALAPVVLQLMLPNAQIPVDVAPGRIRVRASVITCAASSTNLSVSGAAQSRGDPARTSSAAFSTSFVQSRVATAGGCTPVTASATTFISSPSLLFSLSGTTEKYFVANSSDSVATAMAAGIAGRIVFDDLKLIGQTSESRALNIGGVTSSTTVVQVVFTLLFDNYLDGSWVYSPLVYGLSAMFGNGLSVSAFARVVSHWDAATGEGLLPLSSTSSVNYGEHSIVKFARRSGMASASLFTDEFQDSHCVAGVPLPPIQFQLLRSDGSLNVVNRSVAVRAVSDDVYITAGSAVVSNGWLQITGLVATSQKLTLSPIDSFGSSSTFPYTPNVNAVSSFRLRFVFYFVSPSASTSQDSTPLEGGVSLSELNVWWQLETGRITLVVDTLTTIPYALQFTRLAANSFITKEHEHDTYASVTILNETSFPEFALEVVRPDHLIWGNSQTTQTSSSDSFSLPAAGGSNAYNVVCTLFEGMISSSGKGPVIANWTAPLLLNTLQAYFSTSTLVGNRTSMNVAANSALVSLQCCITAQIAVKNCAPAVSVAVLPAYIVTPGGSNINSSATSDGLVQLRVLGPSLPSEVPFGTSLRSNIVLSETVLTNRMPLSSLSAVLLCSGGSGGNATVALGVCARMTGVDSSISFPVSMQSTLTSATSFTTLPVGINFQSGVAQVPDVFWANANSTPSDGLLFLQTVIPTANLTATSFVNNRGWKTSAASIAVPLEFSPLSSLDVLCAYVQVPFRLAEPNEWKESMAALLQIESSRIEIIGTFPATIPIPQPTANANDPQFVPLTEVPASRIEFRVLPPLTYSHNPLSGQRIEDNMQATQLSCEGFTPRPASPAPSFALSTQSIFLRSSSGQYTVKAAAPDGNIAAVQFCDVALFESLAESSRHCEIFLGPASRCACFTDVFHLIGDACVKERLLLQVCDHLAYCTDSVINSICSSVQPNLPLQVFLVVGSTILALLLIVVVLKYRAIWRRITSLKFAMHDNAGRIKSKQSAASITPFA